jgi:hypothetical protein
VSAVWEAHLRMMEMLRDRIRTHERTYYDGGLPGKGRRDIPQHLVDEVDRMRRAGLKQRQILAELHIGTYTYTRILTILRSRNSGPE